MIDGALALLAVALTGGCAGAPTTPAADTTAVTTLYVVSHGWHAGIAVRQADIPAGLWPERRDFPAAEWLEIGWGDHDYYQARDPGIALTLRAALWPTRGVLHTVGFPGPVGAYFPDSEVVALPATADGLRRLLAFIDTSHDRRAATPAAALGPGLYGDSRYYPARGRFHLFNNCNRWTARALRAAGYDLGSPLTAGQLMAQVRRLAEALKPNHPSPGRGEAANGD